MMYKSKQREPQMTFKAANPTVETHPAVSGLLGDSGNCRQMINQELSLHLLSDSLFSEQQKLRHVLDWAHNFLNSDSEIHYELCRTDSLILADEEQRETQKTSFACTAKYHHPIYCSAGGGEGSMEKVWHREPSHYENSESHNHICAYKPPFSDPCITLLCTPRKAEVMWPEYRETSENMKTMELPDSPNGCLGLSESNQRQCTYLSDRNTNQMLGTTGLIKEFTSCWSNTCHKRSTVSGTASHLKLNDKTAGAQPERNISGLQMELSKVKVEERVGTNKEVVMMHERKMRVNEDQDSEKTQEQMEKTSNLSFSHHLKLPPTVTVYEQYQLCVDHLRVRQSQHIEPRCFTESPTKERGTSEELAAPVEAPALNSSTTHPEIKKHLNQRVRAAEITEERSSDVINKNQDRYKYNRSRATLTERERTITQHCETHAAVCAESRPGRQRNGVTSDSHLVLDRNNCGELINGTAGDKTSTGQLLTGQVRTAHGDTVPAVEESAALTTNTGLLSKRIGRNPDVKGHQRRVRGPKKKGGGRGGLMRLCEKSCVSPSSRTDKEILQRPQSSVIKHTKRQTPEDKVKPTSAYKHTHKCLPPTETHTPPHDDPGPTSPTSGAHQCDQADCKYSPAGVPVCYRWLCLPDEVWLSILSLLPHSDLCRVLQVCSRLHTLATDHTLWKDVRIENSTLTERWFLCVSRRRPRSLSLYSCSGPSLTSRGLEMFFTQCRKTLEELKVTSCVGLGLHGDQMLPLIGQLCDHVTSVDLSWSGATDTGVRALSDCCAGLRLKSVVLNGCHVTDDPLIKLVRRHKESLCRLEVFGCQFLTPSCLQTVYEMCPALEHLNIGKVPKVTAHSLTVMTSQLKCLMSLNLTGLQAVTDAAADTLLQNCVKLQSLTLSSCPGVTDLTLHSISKYTPCVRSLDVSGCTAVTDAGVQSLALGCRRLQQLDLSSTGTGNRGVTLLANYCSRHLHTAKLSFCHITSENILKLCRRCKRLKVLHLYGCTHLPTERQIREVNATVQVYPLP